jgi:hypothetical protein
MAEQPSIDPRYDPAFQRGFDGQVATGSRAQVAARRSTPYVASALQRAPQDRAATPAAAQQIGLPPEAPDAADDRPSEVVVVRAAESAVRPPWTNPFAIAAFVLGVASLAFGVWVMQETVRMMESPESFSTQADYWFMQVSTFGGPIALALGVAILVGVLFLCANYWSRRPQPVETD